MSATAANGTSEVKAVFPPRFDWPLAGDGESLVRDLVAEFLAKNSFAKTLAARMREETGTDFFEWTDHLVVAPAEEKRLRAAGFVPESQAGTPDGAMVLAHPLATLPRIILHDGGTPSALALKPEFVSEFVAAQHLEAEIQGEPFSRYRRVVVAEENGLRLEAVERRAYRGLAPAPLEGGESAAIVQAKEIWRTRQRFASSDAEGIQAAYRALERSMKLVGRDLSCQFFFEAERAYWESRNLAARIQKRRQDLLGLGWGNHDHHTFRCSRAHFVDLIEFLIQLGFQKRERYYAGSEAGWGAQISEQPVTGIVVFADVDLMPEETQIDFSTHKLPAAPRLGTVGLWVGLHGESFLEAGMHHLEARFEFDRLRDQLKECGINTMKPFSNFEFLRQAFTEGERWAVPPGRLQALLASGLITQVQHDQFLREGAIGSHLENLERHGGFKGFNQKSVSAVISATDPRRTHFQSEPAAA